MISGKKDIRCGLIGEHLSHSFSPQIHRQLSDYSYSLFEMSESEVGDFLKSGAFDSTNVTIPYKKTVMPFLDEISDEAMRIGSVNTITHLPDGRLKGDNTDYYGFSYLVHKSGIEIRDKSVLILGTGGASLTARTVCADMGAGSITFVSRSGEVNYENVYVKCADTEVVINCTPVGMYPKNGISPIELSRLENCVGVVDMIYNPAKTQLLLDAERLNIPCINGLSMLVAQAKRACELFLSEEIDDSEIDRITYAIERETKNIILIGMPGCGKSTVGAILSSITGRELLDTDSMIVEAEGRDIPTIFADQGEEYFRQCEHRAVCKAGKLSGKIIATGGGVVTRRENLDPLRQNGEVFFIHRSLEALATIGRPLSKSGKLAGMYETRLPLYKGFCSAEVSNDSSAEECAKKIIAVFGKDGTKI